MSVLAEALLAAYRGTARLATPAVWLLLRRRVRRGKEDPARLSERWGYGAQPRPAGPLLWMHAASVGESLAVLPLIEAIQRERPELTILMTSGTVTSARLLAERLPPGVIHQFAPLDLPQVVARFLKHWRPDLTLFVESELWPGMLRALRRRKVPLALVNARMSERSYRGWRRFGLLARRLLGGIALILAESPPSAERFRKLGAPLVSTPGNLKAAAAPLAADPERLSALRTVLGQRPCWVAASTHPGEEAIVLAAHRNLALGHPGVLTVVVPRHPERGRAVAEMAQASGLPVAQRSRGALPNAETAVYVADTLGELGLFYRVAQAVFVGGSLVPKGGQNLLEPARLGRALLAGPHTENFATVAEQLTRAGALLRVEDAESLARTVGQLLSDGTRRGAVERAAEGAARTEARVLEQTLEALRPLLSAAAAPA